MIDKIVAISGENLTHDEKIGREEMKRFAKVALGLFKQGEKLKVMPGREMRVFVGRSGDEFVEVFINLGESEMDRFFGKDLKEFYVVSIGREEALSLLIVYKHGGFWEDKDIEKFEKAKINSTQRKEIENCFPGWPNILSWDAKGTKKDFLRLTEVLEQTKIDKALLEQTIRYHISTPPT